MRAFILVAILFTTFTSTCLADQLRTAKSKTEAAKKKFDSIVETQNKLIQARLDRLETSAVVFGNSELQKKVDEARSDFERDGSLPTIIPTDDYRKVVNLAYEQCLSVFNNQIAVATRSRDSTTAETIERWRDSFESEFEANHRGVRLFRTLWTHAIGRFEKINEDQWVEHTDNGRHSFVEKSRNPNCVTLIDVKRRCMVVLTDSECIVKFHEGVGKTAHVGSWTR